MKIAHISDIHWRGLTRHAEYTKAFNRVFFKLEEIKPDIIFLGGDLFHTKTSGISPEVIDRLVWMMKGFGDIAPTHIILGNHDGNLANEDREDAISPLVKAMSHGRIRLYKQSGVFRLFNGPEIKRKPDPALAGLGSGFLDPMGPDHEWHAKLGVFSCFDKDGWATVAPNPYAAINIAAFHGSVGGSKMDNGWVMPEDKAEVKISMFDGYDFVLLGDIHKRQFLAERPDKNGVMKPYIAYPGSTIQQNHGEEENKGFLVWDIRAKDDWDVEYVQVTNYQPFVTFPWAGGVEETTEELIIKRKAVYDGTRYRITSQAPLSLVEERQLTSILKAKFGAGEVLYKPKEGARYTAITANGVNIQKASLRNSPSAFAGLYGQFLDANTKKYQLSEKQIAEGKVAIADFLKKFNEEEPESTRDLTWSLKSFEFDNLFRYGPGNKLDFHGLEGIVGVFGKNKLGKSSLIGALMYALFNGSDREGVTKNGQIMNQTKKSCMARAVVNVNGTDYVIERTSSRAEAPKKGKKVAEFDTDKTETKLTFTKLLPDGSREELNGISRDETDKAVRKLLGSAQDFLMTSVATQGQMESFINEGPTARKAILNRFLDLDIFDKLYLYAKEEVAALNAKTSKYLDNWDQVIQEHQLNIAAKEKEAAALEQQLIETRSAMDSARAWIVENESKDAQSAAETLVKVQQELFLVNRQHERANLDLNQLLAAMTGMKSEIKILETERDQTDVVELHKRIEEMKAAQEALRNARVSLKEEQTTLDAQEKSVRKLNLVPCGDSFPECMYIKDSHNDKKKIDAQREQVQSVAALLETYAQNIKTYEEQRFSEKMNRYMEVQQFIKDMTREYEEKKNRQNLLETTKKNLAIRLNQLQKQEGDLSGKIVDLDTAGLEDKRRELKELQALSFKQERDRSDLMVGIGRSRAALEQIEKDRVECEGIVGKLRVLESVQAAFHKNGIPAIVLKTQLPAINAELSKILGGLVDFSITFDTEPGSNVMDVYIEDGHSRRVLELGSGMEKMIASIAIRVALINLSSLPKSDILVIDEGFNALDEEHVGKCLELLQTLKGYFRTILVISHMQRVKEAADTIIEVVSTGLDSKIEA